MRVLSGGEALTATLATRLLALDVQLWNVYGPTETTIWSTVERVTNAIGIMSVGRPIANTTAYILDEHRQPVPVGVPGELYLGGVGVASGYWNNPELTAQRFLKIEAAEGRAPLQDRRRRAVQT